MDVIANYLPVVLGLEGDISDEATDPGGLTKWGITHINYDAWRARNGLPQRSVVLMTVDEMTAIYREDYWNKCRCGELPFGLDLAVFDCAVNQGEGRAKRFLQQALGVKPDGDLGELTMGAVHRLSATASLDALTEFMALRMQAYGLLTALFKTYGHGWSRRLMKVYRRAMWEAWQAAGQTVPTKPPVVQA
jgi:lysozyme family protein